MAGQAELTPIEWAVRPIKLYARFTGRASRAEYWWYYLGTIILGIVAGLFDRLLQMTVIQNALNVALFVPWIAVSVRRLHDIDRSGWWMLSLLIPVAFLALYAAGSMTSGSATAIRGALPFVIIGVVVFLVIAVTFFVFMVTPGTVGPNRYGSDPYGPDQLEEVFA